jgi:hypothetical protein
MCAVLVSTPALGGGSAEGPPIEPKADQLLQQMGEYLKSTKQYTFRADVSFDQVLESGQKLLYTARVEASKRRPDRLMGHFKGGDLHEKRFWYDGKSVTLLDEKLNSYATVEVPAEIDAALDHLATRYGFTAPISGLLLNDPYPRLIKNVQSGSYIGLQEIRGVKTHHLAFTQESIDWQIWIQDDEKRPVPWMVVITYKDVQGSPQYEARLTDWGFPVRMPDSQFTSVVPENAMKMEFLPLAERPTYSK